MALNKQEEVTRLEITRVPGSDTEVRVRIFFRERVTDDATGQVFDGAPNILDSDAYAKLTASERAKIKGRINQLVAAMNGKVPDAN